MARRWLADREAEADRERLGVVTREDRRLSAELGKPIGEHLERFDDSMLAAGRADSHRRTTRRYIESVASDLRWRTLRDVTRGGMEGWLASGKREGKSARTRNAALVAVRSFLNWAKRADIIRANPLDGIPRSNERADPRRPRRALDESSLIALLAAAEARPLAEAMTVRRGSRRGQPCACVSSTRRAALELLGLERAMAYRALFFTGLRVGELRSIRLCDLALDENPPRLMLAAKSAKNRRASSIVLRPDLVEQIRALFERRRKLGNGRTGSAQKPDPSSPAFLVPSGFLRILNRDLAFAGIAKRSCDGRTFDLHAFRTSLCTHLARAGVPLRTAQEVMRHSNPSLTANIYTDPALLQVEAALAAIPSFEGARPSGGSPPSL